MSLVKNHEPRPGTLGDGYPVWFSLKEKFLPDDLQNRRDQISGLNNMTMKEGADPDTFTILTYGTWRGRHLRVARTHHSSKDRRRRMILYA